MLNRPLAAPSSSSPRSWPFSAGTSPSPPPRSSSVGEQDERLEARPAHRGPSDRPHFVATAVHAEAVVRLVPGTQKSRPVHGPLGHHRHVRRHRRRHGGVGERADPASRRRASAGLLAYRPCWTTVVPLSVQERERRRGRRGVGIADQHERVEERTGGALGEEPGCGRRPSRRPIRGRRRTAAALPKYIARSAMIGSRDSHHDRERLANQLRDQAGEDVHARGRLDRRRCHDRCRRTRGGTSPSTSVVAAGWRWRAARTCRRSPASLRRTATRVRGPSTALPVCAP